ncbi:MAG: ribbon-helix-helix domain-containing protein [Deinococcota bacterium]|jgi:Arc/MetJ-type ribon-helix-helix transcriptional regulator|nr:ribbon-helix-helix domain-containing protein [Deinococcota bacterium]
MEASRNRTKVSITIPEPIITEVDHLVEDGSYPSRSAAFEDALRKLLRAHLDAHIEAEAAKLDREAEMAEAEEGMADYAVLVED